MYILDTWGVKGSYYLYEGGDNTPMNLIDKIVEHYISRKKYRNVYTGGTSKGGTAALYFGLKHNVTAVFSGACQYNVGTYLYSKKHIPIFRGMMGLNAGERERKLLDQVMPTVLKEKNNTVTKVYLLYSKLEPTYDEEIVDLKKDLEKNKIPFEIQEEIFQEHDEVGLYFPSFVNMCISQPTKNETKQKQNN